MNRTGPLPEIIKGSKHILHSQKRHPVSVPETGSIQFYYSIGPAMLNSGDTVIPGNIPYQDLVFSTEPAILTAS